MKKFCVLLCLLVVSRTGQAQQRLQQPPQQQQANYRPYSQAPAPIKQLLQFQQARDPIVNIPAQPPPSLEVLRRNNAQHGQNQGQVTQYQPQVQYGNAPQQPTYRNLPGQGQGAGRPQYQSQLQQYRPQQAQPQQYRPQQAQPQYSSKLPPHIQQILQAQQQNSNIIPRAASPQRRY